MKRQLLKEWLQHHSIFEAISGSKTHTKIVSTKGTLRFGQDVFDTDWIMVFITFPEEGRMHILHMN